MLLYCNTCTVRMYGLNKCILIDKNSKIRIALQPSECTQIKEITLGFIWVLSFKCSFDCKTKPSRII